MTWRAITRSVALRLALLVGITAAGPAGAASSWHLFDQRGDHLGVGVNSTLPSVVADAGKHRAAGHCAICQFGAAVRAFLPSPALGMVAPSHQHAAPAHVFLAHPDDPTATGHSGRAPPSLG